MMPVLIEVGASNKLTFIVFDFFLDRISKEYIGSLHKRLAYTSAYIKKYRSIRINEISSTR